MTLIDVFLPLYEKLEAMLEGEPAPVLTTAIEHAPPRTPTNIGQLEGLVDDADLGSLEILRTCLLVIDLVLEVCHPDWGDVRHPQRDVIRDDRYPDWVQGVHEGWEVAAAQAVADRKTARNQILAESDFHLLLWRRHGSGRRTFVGSSPDLFANLLVVPKAALDAVRGPSIEFVASKSTQQPAASIIPALALVGGCAFVDDVAEFTGKTAGGYRVDLNTAAGTLTGGGLRSRIKGVLAEAVAAEVDLVTLPEGTGGPQVSPSWAAELSGRRPRRLVWALTGSGSPDNDRSVAQPNRAVLHAWGRGPKPVLVHDKLYPYAPPATRLAGWGFEEMAQVESDAAEDIQQGQSIQVLESSAGRICFLICEDLSKFARFLTALKQVGPTHVVVIVLDEALAPGRWEADDAFALGRGLDTRVFVYNSTAVQRYKKRPEADPPKPVTAGQYWERRWKMSFAASRRNTDIMIPQYGAYGSPLHCSDLKPGDVLYFLRNPLEHPALGALNARIAKLDRTHFVHAAVVLEPDANHPGDTLLADSYHRATVRPLRMLHDYGPFDRGTNPMMVARWTDPERGQYVADEARALTDGEPGYPFRDLLLVALYLVNKQVEVPRDVLNALAAEFSDASEAMTRREPEPRVKAGLMCGAFIAQAFENAGFNLTELRPPEPADDTTPLNQQANCLEAGFGRRWLLDGLAPEDVERDTELAQAFRDYVLGAMVPEADDAELLLNGAGPWIGHLLEALPDEMDPQEKVAQIMLWLTSGNTMRQPNLPDPTDEDWKPARMHTVADLLLAPALKPLGYMARWWESY